MEEVTPESSNVIIDIMLKDIRTLYDIVKGQQVTIENLTKFRKLDIDQNVSQQKINNYHKQWINENKQRLDGLEKKFNDLLRIIAEQQVE